MLKYATLLYKPSVISSFDPPKVEKRWRFLSYFLLFEFLKKSVMGSIPGAAPVLFFASPTVPGGTIIKIGLSQSLFRHKTCKCGRLQILTRKDSLKKLCIRVDSNSRSLDNWADALQSEPLWQRVSCEKKPSNYSNVKPENLTFILHNFFRVFNRTSLKFYCSITF